MIVKNKEQAFLEADKIFPSDYNYSPMESKIAGYPIYTSQVYKAWISDLNNRLEVNLPDGKTVNIWIEDKTEKVREQLARITKELYS